MIGLAASTAAALAITPFQDLLGLGSAARMNVPGRPEGQWRWRCPRDESLNAAAFQRISEITARSDRLAVRERNLNECRP
jgi:4-alpha-glucanotransferase